jgi:membrane associated rhomboid family serine protease
VTPLTGTFLFLNSLLWLVYFGSGQPPGWTRLFLIPNQFTPVALLTSQFVHAGALHLALNMLLLWTFGRSVERRLGPVLFAVVYLGSGVFAGLLHVAVAYLFQAQAELAMPAGGASGAVAGVMGAYAAIYPQRRTRLPLVPLRVSGLTVILVWLGWEAAQAVVALRRGLELGVGHWAHVGGLVFGLLLGPALAGSSEPASPPTASDRDRPPPEAEGSSFLATAEGAAEAVEHLTRAGERPYALALYRQAIDAGRPLKLPGPVELRIAGWLAEEEDWAAACDAFLSVAHAGEDPEQAAAALYRAMQVASDHLQRPQLADRLRQDLRDRFPRSRWSALVTEPSPEEQG